MPERTTAKEVSIDLAGFKSSVDKQMTLLMRLIFGVYVVIGAVVGGGFLLRSDLGDIKAELAKTAEKVDTLRRDATVMQEHISKLPSDIADSQEQTSATLAALRTEIRSDLSRIYSRLPGPEVAPLNLSVDETNTIRFFFGLPATPNPKISIKYRIGDVPYNVKPIPDNLVEKVPGLAGLGYTKDPDTGSVLICDPMSRIVAIVPA